MVAEKKAKTIVATLGYVEPEAPVDTLTDPCTGGGRDCWRHIEEVKAKALVYRQADRLRQVKAKTSSDTVQKGGLDTGGHDGGTASRGGGERVSDTLGIVESEHCSILWLKG